jgi:hypothetical protein
LRTPVTVGTPVTIGATPDATTTLLSRNDQNQLQVSYTIERDEASIVCACPPEGSQWLIVIACIENATAKPVTRESLVLISEDGEEYEADATDESAQPPLAGAELAPVESLLGLVRFTVPDYTIRNVLEWCSLGPLSGEVTVRAPIPRFCLVASAGVGA